MALLDSNDRAQACIKWTVLGLSILTCVFAVVAVAHCSFFLIGAEGTDRGDLLGFGLFKGETGDGCESYPSEIKDIFEAPEKSGRAFGTLAALLTGFGMTLVVLTMLLVNTKFQDKLWLAVRVLFILAFFSQALTFTVFASQFCKDNGGICTPGAAGIIAIFNILFLLALCVLTFKMKAPEPTFDVCSGGGAAVSSSHSKPTNKNQAREEELVDDDEEFATTSFCPSPTTEDSSPAVHIVKTIQADGSTKTTKTVTNPDGSKTITTTVEEK